jgi:ABC-type lipoprotein export system ATPase subunit
MATVPAFAAWGPGAAALAFEAVTCAFAGKSPGERYTAVADTSLVVNAGEFVSVVGPTGCGKSTLLNVAAGLPAPSSGRATVDGKPLDGINRRAGYMFQADALMPWRSALDNVIAGLEFRGVPRAEALRRGNEWLERVGLTGFGNGYPHQLSGGMRKRVALAQMLILDPEILLMDEPFLALDVGQIYPHLAITLWVPFAVGSVLGLVVGLWLALTPTASAIAEPYITALNAMPRVILAPIFAVWFGLGVLSKVALGVTLVFFIVFFNVYQGVKEVNLVVLAMRRCSARRSGSCCARSTCRRPRRGCSRACTRRSAWRSWARSSANTWARRRASAT